MDNKKINYKKPLIKENKINILNFTGDNLLADCCNTPGCNINPPACHQCATWPSGGCVECFGNICAY